MVALRAGRLRGRRAGERVAAGRAAPVRVWRCSRPPCWRAPSSKRTHARSSSCWRRWAASTPPSRKPRSSSCSSRISTTRGCRWRRCRRARTAPRRTWSRRWRPTAWRALAQVGRARRVLHAGGVGRRRHARAGRVAGLIAAVLAVAARPTRGGRRRRSRACGAGMRGAGASLLEAEPRRSARAGPGPRSRRATRLAGPARRSRSWATSPAAAAAVTTRDGPGHRPLRPTRIVAPTPSAWRRLAAWRRARRSFRRGSIRASPKPVQVAALAALATVPGDAVGRFVLRVWPTLTPGARSRRRRSACWPTRRANACWSRRCGTGAVQSWAMNFWQKREPHHAPRSGAARGRARRCSKIAPRRVPPSSTATRPRWSAAAMPHAAGRCSRRRARHATRSATAPPPTWVPICRASGIVRRWRCWWTCCRRTRRSRRATRRTSSNAPTGAPMPGRWPSRRRPR